uniref:Uncharacterized protein n=1 Tax=Terrapene triunguis TaxID=2587831 RepID=A0A674JT02_9SAUR
IICHLCFQDQEVPRHQEKRGSVLAQFLWIILGPKRRIPLPGDTVEDLLQHISYTEPLTLTQFLEKFALYMPAIARL